MLVELVCTDCPQAESRVCGRWWLGVVLKSFLCQTPFTFRVTSLCPGNIIVVKRNKKCSELGFTPPPLFNSDFFASEDFKNCGKIPPPLPSTNSEEEWEQAGAELCQAQHKLC